MRPALLIKILAPASLAALLATWTAILATRRRFKGFAAFLIPLTPSLGLISLYIPLLFLDAVAPSRPFLIEAGRALRQGMGITWVLFSHIHHRLNNPAGPGLRGLPAAAAVTVFNVVFYAAARIFPPLLRYQAPVSSVLVSATLLYAGVSAFTIFRFTNRLEVSSWTGIVIAGFSLVYYPLVALAEVFNATYPLFTYEFPAVMQTHPYYMVIVCAIIAAGLLTARSRARERESAGARDKLSALSPREREIFDLLMEGLSLQEISRKSFLSLSTVKSHLGRIYSKLGVSGRHEAAALYRNEESAPSAARGKTPTR